jgi:hypothetical protein
MKIDRSANSNLRQVRRGRGRAPSWMKRNVLALTALFIALGGVSYAAVMLPAASVGTRELKKEAVTLAKIAPSARKVLHGARGPAGAPGAKGDSGAPGTNGTDGAPGSAKAYAFIAANGDVDLTRSKGVIQSNVGRPPGGVGTYCIHSLPFTPKIAVATTEGWGYTAHIHYGEAPGICPTGVQIVVTVRTAGAGVDGSFSILIAD